MLRPDPVLVLAALLAAGPASAQATPPATAKQFSSGGLKVEVNRATLPEKGDVGISLVVTNTQEAAVELFTIRDIQALTDTGTTFTGAKVGGLPACTSGSAERCSDSIASGRFTPLSIDAGQSATVTLSFANRSRRTAAGAAPCGIDLSMPVYVRTLAGRTPSAWKLVTVGLPNIKVC